MPSRRRRRRRGRRAVASTAYLEGGGGGLDMEAGGRRGVEPARVVGRIEVHRGTAGRRRGRGRGGGGGAGGVAGHDVADVRLQRAAERVHSR